MPCRALPYRALHYPVPLRAMRCRVVRSWPGPACIPSRAVPSRSCPCLRRYFVSRNRYPLSKNKTQRSPVTSMPSGIPIFPHHGVSCPPHHPSALDGGVYGASHVHADICTKARTQKIKQMSTPEVYRTHAPVHYAKRAVHRHICARADMSRPGMP